VPTTQKQDQELREKVLSIEQTQNQVLLPKITGIEENVQRLVDRDYLTKSDARSTYASKEDLEILASKTAFTTKIVYAVISSLVLGIIALGFSFLQGRLQ
jgi:hypothetical protein